jgi:hypothetical protein
VVDGYIEVPEDALERVKSWARNGYGVEYDGLDVVSESSDLSDLDHDELKKRAEDAGIAGEIDLRSKDNIVEALQE